MTAVWIRARAEFRARWRALVAAAILTGLFGGAVLAALAGATRTRTAYPRFLEGARGYDVLITDSTLFGAVFWKPDFAALARLPYVETAVPVVWGYVHAGVGSPEEGTGFVGSNDPRFGKTIAKPLLARGRMPVTAEEVAVPFFADRKTENGSPDLGSLRVGDTISADAHGRSVTLRVVGETVLPGELPPRPQWGWQMVVAPAFLEKYVRGCEVGGPRCAIDFSLASMMLRFQHRSDVDRFDADVKTMTHGKVLASQVLSTHTRAVQGSTDLQAQALRLLALFIALTGLLIIGQLLAREIALGATEDGTMRALGFSGGQQVAFGFARALPIAIGGAVLAVSIAALISPVFPRGSVRVVAGPLFSLDKTVLGLGAAGVLVAVMLLVLYPAWRSAVNAGRVEATSSRPSAIASAMTTAGLSPPAIAGTRLALERGRGRTAVPVVSSLIVVAIGIGSFIAATTFALSLSAMIGDPTLYGKSWDGVITSQVDAFSDDPASQIAYSKRAAAALAADPDVAALAVVDSGAPLNVVSATGPRAGISVLGMSVENVKGSLYPPIVEGRPPSDPHEVVLGARMIKALGLTLNAAHPPEVGVGLQGASDRRVTLRVVGRGIIPPLGNFGELGFGVMLASNSSLGEVLDDPGSAPPTTDLIVRWRRGAKPADVIARIQKHFPEVRIGEGLTGGKFADAVNFGGVQGAPLMVGGVLAALGAAALAHVLVTSIRRRRRDLAILKTLGFIRGQARRAIAWQATVIVLFASIAGIPFGLVAGRLLWARVASGIGVLSRPQTSVLVLAVIVPAVVILANIIAVAPARSAARTQPALVLRALE